ncbi:hypothetical protein N9093_01820 [bacterium]|nr:hypothetical protein [bacterium]
MDYVKFEKLNLKSHPELNETWVQDRIAEDPKILGLGDIYLKDKERIQPRAGRLDLLLQEADGNRRYEVEIQLGPSDESHIIRTIEYWDIERKRYPQYEHAAVIVAEDITSRFLNVISLFNGMIPIIAIQMSALKSGEKIGLVFTTVVNQLSLGMVDEDEEIAEVTDRGFWVGKTSKKTLAMVDELCDMVKTFDPELELKYNKFYIGLAKNGLPNNFVVFNPKKNFIRIEPRIIKSEETQERLETAGLDVMDYDVRWGRYRIRLNPNDMVEHKELLVALIGEAYEAANS